MPRTQNILITGATSGIGEALALYYAQTSAKNLFLCGRDQTRLQIVAQKCEQLGAVVFPQIIDVTNREAMQNWINKCEQTSPLNLVIANAGVATVEETTANIYNTFNTNVGGVLNTILPAIENYRSRIRRQDNNSDSSLDKFISRMKKQKRAFSLGFFQRKYLADKGCEFFHDDQKTLVIISSIAGYHGLPTCPSYSASKACVKAWGEALRLQLKPLHINVSVVCPGFVRSRITDRNTCPMPFFMEANQAAELIARRVASNVGLIAFPWPMRFSSWLLSVLPNRLSDFIYSRLPHKV